MLGAPNGNICAGVRLPYPALLARSVPAPSPQLRQQSFDFARSVVRDPLEARDPKYSYLVGCFPSVTLSASPCALMERDGGRLGISLHEGIGPAKGFGCGLLSLERG